MIALESLKIRCSCTAAATLQLGGVPMCRTCALVAINAVSPSPKPIAPYRAPTDEDVFAAIAAAREPMSTMAIRKSVPAPVAWIGMATKRLRDAGRIRATKPRSGWVAAEASF